MTNLSALNSIHVASRKFQLIDQLEFARFSGDFNPIHVDPIYARRSIFGECIVHGVHGLLWALNELTEKINVSCHTFKCDFLKPISLDTKIDIYWNAEKRTVKLMCKQSILTVISIIGESKIKKQDKLSLKKRLPFKSPKVMKANWEKQDLSHVNLAYRGKLSLAKKLFPNIVELYGVGNIAEIVVATEIVGMEMPGLNSLFTSLKGTFVESEVDPLQAKIVSVDERFGLVNMHVRGLYTVLEIEAFFRSLPAVMSSLQEVEGSINLTEFSSVNALIIGGTRGLGELTAKVISLGGGRVTITYNTGKDDAIALQNELILAGGHCDILKLNVTDDSSYTLDNFNQLYYFATPKIRPETGAKDDVDLYLKYQSFYVTAFENLIKRLGGGINKLNIFYPSTEFIDETPLNFRMYSRAKADGEAVCKRFEGLPKIKIVRPRLPRMKTDQTSGLAPEVLSDSLPIMIPLIREMSFE